MHLHPITAQSFAIIDREIGSYSWTPSEYAIVRRAIHATADFELGHLFQFSEGAIASGITALQQQQPVLVDVRMVQMGITSTLSNIGYGAEGNGIIACALDHVPNDALEATTRTAAGLLVLLQQYPDAIVVIGNAPTALLALVEQIRQGQAQPALVIGVPVGFVAVEEAKQALASVDIPQIQVTGRKGGSPVAAAIINALAYLADPHSLAPTR
ncbi:MAG: cobalt-precorrin-8X methylmutase [Cyanothece sp. SIO2G6]|nr:cobalt-precorrin-8X methylmutase [Cyanothece sp. SIO2G6]